MKRVLFSALACALLACGGSGETGAPAATPADAPKAPVAANAEKKVEESPAKAEAPRAETPAPAPAEAAAEPCESGWICMKVDLATRKAEKRATKLIGDPKIEQTFSKTTDGRGPVAFDFVSKGPVELLLRRKPVNKAEIVIKAPGGPEVIIDRHEGDDFTYIGAVAAEQGGAFLVDIRYMK